MKIAVNQKLKDYKGQELTQMEGDKERPMTVADAMIVALNYQDKDTKMDALSSVKAYKKSVEIMSAKEPVDIDIDTAKIIKDNLVLVYGPLVAGQVIALLEN